MVLDEAQTRGVQPESRLWIDGQPLLDVAVCVADFALTRESAAQCMVYRGTFDALGDLIGEMPLRLRRPSEQNEAMSEVDVQVDSSGEALQRAFVALQVLCSIAIEPDRVIECLVSLEIVGSLIDRAAIRRQRRFVLTHVVENVAAGQVQLRIG
jgi:hypothetical protein